MQAQRTIRRILLIFVAVVVLAPIAVVGLFVARFDPNSYKPQLIALVDKMTHRQLSIEGKLRMNLSLVPTISASGLTLANPPGYADANFVTLKRIEARVALLPLFSHRLNILKLVLVDPVINLEYGPTGEPDWLIDQNATAAPAAGGASRPGSGKRGAGIALQSVSIENATITYRPSATLAPLTQGEPAQATAKPTVLHIAHFTGRATSLDSPLHVDIAAQYNGAPFTISGTTGPVSRLTGATATASSWPVDLTVSGKGASLHVAGKIAHPRHASGYLLKLHATIPDLAALAPYLPPTASGLSLPPLQSVDARAEIGDPGRGTLPTISDVSITAGQSDLGSWRKGLSINSLNLTLPTLDQSLNIALAGQYEGKQLGLEGKAGPLAPIVAAASGVPSETGALATPRERFTVNLAAKVGDAMFNVVGGIATPSKLAGVALRLDATIPNLATLSDLAGTPLPAWTNIGFSGLLTDPGGQGLEHAIGLNSLAISATQAQIGGAFSLRLGPTPDLQAVIHIPRIDLSGLIAAMPKPQPPASVVPATATGTASQAGTPATASAKAANPLGTSGMVIPDTPLPLNLLRTANGNVELTIDQLKYRNAEYDAITAHGLLRNGVLTVRPISAEMPGGPVAATLNVNAAANPPTIHVTESAPAFRLGPLLALFGQPNAASATMQLYANLKGAGRTPHDIASNLNGSLGISTVNGEIDGKLLNRLLADAGLPGGLLGTQGPVALRCFATRLDAKSGVVSLRALTLDSDRLFMTGSGKIDLATEGLDLLFLPEAAITGGNTPIPFAVTGLLGNPSTNIAKPQAYGQALSQLGQRIGGTGGTLLGHLANRLGIEAPPASARSCTGALALARMGHPGPAPQGASNAGPNAAPAGSGTSPGKATGPQNLLQSLFH